MLPRGQDPFGLVGAHEGVEDAVLLADRAVANRVDPRTGVNLAAGVGLVDARSPRGDVVGAVRVEVEHRPVRHRLGDVQHRDVGLPNQHADALLPGVRALLEQDAAAADEAVGDPCRARRRARREAGDLGVPQPLQAVVHQHGHLLRVVHGGLTLGGHLDIGREHRPQHRGRDHGTVVGDVAELAVVVDDQFGLEPLTGLADRHSLRHRHVLVGDARVVPPVDVVAAAGQARGLGGVAAGVDVLPPEALGAVRIGLHDHAHGQLVEDPAHLGMVAGRERPQRRSAASVPCGSLPCCWVR